MERTRFCSSLIDLKNVAVYSEHTSPVITIRNGQHISFEQFRFKPGAELLLLLAGERTEHISLPGTDISSAKAEFQYTEGASPKTLR
jgi:DNA sulfur modification protein DndE